MSAFTEQCQSQPVNYYGVYAYPTGCRQCIGVPESLTTNPWIRYQTQKRIQNTVGVSSSEYAMNLASVTAFEHLQTWNGQSDRFVRHVQRVKSGNRTSNKPGYMSPGGSGCDIKHNSYERRLLRLKGKGPLRREPIPTSFLSSNVPFNLADPIRGDKRVKTSIVNGNNAFDCTCYKNEKNILTKENTVKLLQSFSPSESSQSYSFYEQYPYTVGSTVYAVNPNNKNKIEPAIVVAYDESTNIVIIKFVSEPQNTISVSGSELFVGAKTCKIETNVVPDVYFSETLKTSPITSGIIHYI